MRAAYQRCAPATSQPAGLQVANMYWVPMSIKLGAPVTVGRVRIMPDLPQF